MARRPLSLGFKGATPAQAALIARKEPARTERQQMGSIEEGSGEMDAPAPESKTEVSVPTKPEQNLISAQESQKSEPKKPKVEEQAGNDTEETPENEKDASEETSPRAPKKRARRGARDSAEKRKKFEALSSDPLVTQTFRVPRSLSERLQIASMQRKVKRLFPASQQDIVAEALSDWLDKMEDEE